MMPREFCITTSSRARLASRRSRRTRISGCIRQRRIRMDSPRNSKCVGLWGGYPFLSRGSALLFAIYNRKRLPMILKRAALRIDRHSA